MKYFLFVIALVVSLSIGTEVRGNTLVSGDVTISILSLNFGTSSTLTKDSLSFWIRNGSNDTVHVSDINTFEEVFTLRDTMFTIQPEDSVQAWVYFSSIHNLTYSDVGVIENTGANGSLAFTITGTKQYPDSYYSSTQGLSGEALKTAIHNLVINHTNRGYTPIRDMMFLSVDTVDGQLECVYTGRKITVTNRIDMQTNGNFNTEHTWPQSKFNEQEPERADINHLFPSDETANGKRSNFPFDVVVGTPTWEVGGSKLGHNSNNATVFEPRNVHKGDLARAMFYFIVRYQNWGTFWTDAGVNQEAAFRIWNKQDPVSAKEMTRNNRIAQPSVQGKRNPFIDHPEFVDRISKFDGTATIPSFSKIVVSPLHTDSLYAVPGDTARYTMVIVNAGNATLNITSISPSNSVFSVSVQTTSISAHNFINAELRFAPTATDSVYSGTITFNSNDGTNPSVHLNVIGSSSGITAVVDESNQQPALFTLEQNYPNPFNPSTTLSFVLGHSTLVSLKVYDMLGREIATLVNGVQDAGYKSVQFDASTLPSGVYTYRLTAGDFTSVKKLLLMR